MVSIVANTSVLIPYQFPDVFREQGPVFVAFVQAYYQWLEQQNNLNYYVRNYYNIKDVDNTFDQFVVYFKEKFLKNIKFDTAADIRQVIKHALDIYRSKGTERCATLLFQIAFNVKPGFYYPSTDIFKLDDGVWTAPYYLELSLNWEYNILLQQKEVRGVFSGARAFVDTLVRRKTNGRLEDVAYISSIVGRFQAGEKIQPTDGSLDIMQCPTLMGSLNAVQLLQAGSGTNYTVGSLVPLSSQYGESGIGQVVKSSIAEGEVQLEFVDGGYGYQVNAVQATITYQNLSSGTWGVGNDIFTWTGGSVVGIGTVLTVNATNSTYGVLTVDVLSGNLNNTFYSFGNTQNAHVNTFVSNTYGPNVYISNATLTISNMTMSTANLEQIHYFQWLETITEPMGTINYISANGALPIGANIYEYFTNGSVAGVGTIIESTAGTSNTGTIIVSVLSGNLQTNTQFFTLANTVQANLAASNGYTNSTATGVFIANASTVTLNLSNVTGIFLGSEEIFQTLPLSGPVIDEKIGGWGFLEENNSANVITIDMMEGRFVVGPIKGLSSGATANVISVNINLGVVNTSGQFLASPYSYVFSGLCSGNLTSFSASGTSFAVSVLPVITYPENVSTCIDKISTYANTKLNASQYGFPAFPSGNGTNTPIANLFTYAQTTIGKLNSVVMTGVGSSFNEVPYIIIDNPYVSDDAIYDDFVQFSGATGTFDVGEVITQVATNAKGMVKASSNTLILALQRLSYTNNFVKTTNSTTTIIGFNSGTTANVVAVDYDIFSPVMGRNTLSDVLFTTGNNVLTQLSVIDSGYGFLNGEDVTVGSNGAIGTAVVSTSGVGSGFYYTKGGFIDDVKKFYDGYFYQNFSYQIIAPLMIQKYQQMIQEITHVAGTIMFGRFVHTGINTSNVQFLNSTITIH